MFSIKLNKDQRDGVAEYLSNLSLIFFAGLVMPVLLRFDTINIFNASYGMILSVMSLVVSLSLRRKYGNKN